MQIVKIQIDKIMAARKGIPYKKKSEEVRGLN